jgi:ABC-type transport system involved in multi-copper enzyme maturation permease subunit
MSFHLIRIIAAYEMRTLLRSWFFRIFAGGAIFGLGIFNLAINIKASGSPWIYGALASSIPYANLIILNLGQAVVAVFLASEFLKQDRKNDTVEVIYARSMTNGQYILGKTLGILAVFLVLNLVVLFIGIGFSLIGNLGSQSAFPYLAYPLLISLPTLTFILGLSFFLMVLVRNQAVTFILLIGYIALTVFYLSKKAYHLFDYIAFNVPMMYSSISGFGNFGEILLHRSIYFVLGVGLIFLTIYRLQRLPQSVKFMRLPLWAGVLFILTGVGLIWRYIQIKDDLYKYRKELIETNNKYARHPKPMVRCCELDLEHLRNKISVHARLNILNKNSIAIDTLIVSLNPELAIENTLINDAPVKVNRINQILLIPLQETMKPGDSLVVNIHYSGTINENIAFLDQNEENFTNNPVYEVFRMQKKYAFLQKNYVCLTSEVLWYPITGTGYATISPLKHAPDFTKFSLRVKTDPSLMAVSQGKSHEIKNGIVEYYPEYPLPMITLLIGNYEKRSINVDSIEYSLYTIKGHDYFSGYFDQVTDTLPTLIREIKKAYELDLGLSYPFKRLIIAEVPVHFTLDKHLYAFTSDAVQPEMILGPEKGVLFSASDFGNWKYRLEKGYKNSNEEVLPEVIQAGMFNRFINYNFTNRWDEGNQYTDLHNWQTYHIFPLYYTFLTQLVSDKWPVLGVGLETYLNKRNFNESTSFHYYEDLSEIEKINLVLQENSLERLIHNNLAENEKEIPVALRNLVQEKSLYLFNYLKAKYGDTFDTLLIRQVEEARHRSFSFDEFSSRFVKQYHADVADQVHAWYGQKNLPGFIVKDISSYKVKTGEFSKYQIRFQLSNPENVDGIVTLHVDLNEPNNNQEGFFTSYFIPEFSRKIFVPAKTSWDVGFVFNTEPVNMSLMTHISQNLPNSLIYSFSGFNEIRNIPQFDQVQPAPFFDQVTKSNEVIADNEDIGFSYQQVTNQAYLKKLVDRKKESSSKYTSIRSYNPPRIWNAVLRSEFYGHYVHSSLYTRGGTGERSASWKARLSVPGSYDVYFYVNKIHMDWRRSNKAPDYNISVYHDNGIEQINYTTEDVDHGWNYLGTWYISADSGKVDLSNKSNGDIVFADAVKWVLTK